MSTLAMGRQDMIVGGYNVVKAALEPCVKGRDRRARLCVLMSSFVYRLIKVVLSGMLSSSISVENRRDWSTNSPRILNIEIFVFVHAHGDMEQDRE